MRTVSRWRQFTWPPADFPQEGKSNVCSGALCGPELATEAKDGRTRYGTGSPDPEILYLAIERQRLCPLDLEGEVVETLQRPPPLSCSTVTNVECLGIGVAEGQGSL